MLSNLMEQLGQVVARSAARELVAQGHRLTGSLIQSLEADVQTAQGIVINVLGNAYGTVLDTGVSADKIPYSGRRATRGRSAKKSKYITALIEYARRRMNADPREAKRIAFAIAAKHTREGMPTRSSYRYSRTGKRTMWIDDSVDAAQAEIAELLFAFINDSLVITTKK